MTKRRSLAGGKSDILESPLVPRVGLLMDSLPEAVVTTDTAHRITGWNNAAERLFGLSRSTMVGASVLDFLAHDLLPGTDAKVKAALDRGETWTGGAVTRDDDGTTLELRFTAAAIGARDAFEGYVIVAHDITSQVRAERTAETADARFAEFMAKAPAIAYIKDHEGRYVFVNEHARQLKGDPIHPAWQGKTDCWLSFIQRDRTKGRARVTLGREPTFKAGYATYSPGPAWRPRGRSGINASSVNDL